MDKIHNLLTRHVPGEIASHIFIHCLSSDLCPDENEVIRQPLVLGAVCQAWRNIAWTTPQLWTTIVIRIRPVRDGPLQLALLEQWIERSGDLPLHISCRDPMTIEANFTEPFYPLIDLVNRYSSRWKGLYLFVKRSLLNSFTGDGGSISILSDLSVVCELGGYREGHRFSLGTAFPHPQFVNLSNISPSSVDIKWNALTHLEASLHVDELVGVFHHTHQLVTCKIFGCYQSLKRHRIPDTPILLPRLQHLEIRSCVVDLSEIVDAITTPCLRRFYFNSWGRSVPAHNFNSFIIRSNCNLEVLLLSGSIARDGDLLTLLKHLPSSLKRLSLEPSFALIHRHQWLTTEVWDLLKSPRNSLERHFFPNLESFQYVGAQTFSWADMLGAFFDPLSTTQTNHRLKTLDVSLSRNGLLTPVDPNSLRIIRELQRHGTRITIESWDPDEIGHTTCSMIDD